MEQPRAKKFLTNKGEIHPLFVFISWRALCARLRGLLRVEVSPRKIPACNEAFSGKTPQLWKDSRPLAESALSQVPILEQGQRQEHGDHAVQQAVKEGPTQVNQWYFGAARHRRLDVKIFENGKDGGD